MKQMTQGSSHLVHWFSSKLVA